MSGDFPTAAQAAEILERVRQMRPRVHCLMNTVVQKFTADGITVIGGIPSMTTSLEEIESFVTKADALTVNLGTLDAERRKVIRLAIEIANASGKPWIVRGNRAEMSLIGDVSDVVRIETGPVDHLRDKSRNVSIVNGHPWMAKVTGTGCLSGGVIAAFMAVENDALTAAASALAVTGVSAELAAQRAKGPGTFEPAFLDALSEISGEDIINHARIEHEQG